LIRDLGIEEQVRLVNEFLDTNEVLFLLSACDAIVFPYQQSQESASGAVRIGLAAGRPVLTTPLPVFSDLSGIVPQLPGMDARQIAEGIISLLGDERALGDIAQRQREWVRCNSWAVQAGRISNIIRASFEEAHGIELCNPSPNRLDEREIERTQETPAPSEDALAAIQRLFADNSFDRSTAEREAGRGIAEPTEMPGEAERERAKKGSLNGSSRLPQLLSRTKRRKDPRGRLLSYADRARDARNWSAAAKYYKEALDAGSGDPALWVQYGHALKESGNLADAENAYRTSLRLKSDVADTHLQLGHVLKLQGRKIEASTAYFRALVLDPALDHAAFELRGLGWTRARIEFALRRELS
jgi:tetratricopeptide (TPR) repeat protein